MDVFVRPALTSSHPAPAALLVLPPRPPQTHTDTGPCPRRGPRRTNDPANYVFKVFGSCENSFRLAVEGGGGGGGGGVGEGV